MVKSQVTFTALTNSTGPAFRLIFLATVLILFPAALIKFSDKSSFGAREGVISAQNSGYNPALQGVIIVGDQDS